MTKDECIAKIVTMLYKIEDNKILRRILIFVSVIITS